MKIFLDKDAPCTMLILGAVISAGDWHPIAKQLAENQKEAPKPILNHVCEVMK